MTKGRPPIYTTDEQRVAARAVSKLKTKNVTLDADLVDALNASCDKLEIEFGFRPTLSQAVRHLIKKVGV